MKQRAAELRSAIRQAAGRQVDIPLSLVENNARCATNDANEKTLPNGTVWLPAMMEQVWSLQLYFSERWVLSRVYLGTRNLG